MTSEPPLIARELLPDLPNEEPWFELKFQMRELVNGSRRILEQLQTLMSLIGAKAEASKLAGELWQVYDDIDHDAQAHAPRAVQLARHLLTSPGDPVPNWDFTYGCDTTVPLEILECRSLPEAQSQVTLHMAKTLAALQGVHEAVLAAAGVRGPIRSVLEIVLAQATLCEQLLKGPAWQHARDAYRWAEPYWRLMDPEAAAAEDARRAAARAELAAIEAELDTEEARKQGDGRT